MSLEKAIKTEYGNEVTYWKITGLSVAYNHDIAVINLAGYVDADAKQSQLNAIPRNYRVIGDKFKEYFSPVDMSFKDLREIGYNYVKENIEEFKGAIDV